MLIPMRAPENASGFSFAGESYEVDATGFIYVPQEAVEAAKAHRFVVDTSDVQADDAIDNPFADVPALKKRGRANV